MEEESTTMVTKLVPGVWQFWETVGERNVTLLLIHRSLKFLEFKIDSTESISQEYALPFLR